MVERRENQNVLEDYPQEENLAYMIRGLFRKSRTFFEQRDFKPEMEVLEYSPDTKIKDVAFINIPPEMRRELQKFLEDSRPLAWTHLEGGDTKIMLYSDPAYVPKH